jgi:peptide/nickel transport system substrate-binding protein
MQVDPITAKSIEGKKDIVATKIPSFDYVWLGMAPGVKANTSVQLDDAKLRLAARDSIDYQGLINVLMGGAGAAQASPIPNGFPGTSGLALPKQNLSEARNLLQQAGHPNGFTVTLEYPSLNAYGVDFTTAAQLVQADLAEAKIKVTLHPVTFSELINDSTKGIYPMSMVYFAPDYVGSAQYLNFFGLVPGSAWSVYAAGPPSNKPITNPSETATFSQALAATTVSDRDNLYHALALDMIQDNVVVPLLSPDLVLAYRSDIHGVFYSACCNLELWRLSRS